MPAIQVSDRGKAMKFLGKLAVAGFVVFAMLQLVRPNIPAKLASAEVQAPPEIRHILEKDCYSCHSDQRRLSWFDRVVPAYWLVRHDVLTAREHLNFSTLGAKPIAAQRSALFEAVNMIQLGAMPLPAFTKLHPEAKVTPQELSTLKAYLAPWANVPSQPTGFVSTATETPVPVSLAMVRPEFNGLPFDPNFESWKLISTTDRGDNNTFRVILGNDIAIRAAQSGNISPWPDGTRFAKIAWQQELGPDGLVHLGQFVQVELMVKDAERYRRTEGWGWGRWRGLDLKPYGRDEAFVNECTGCHQPVRGDDYVYTLPMTRAVLERPELVNNRAAAMPPTLPYQPLGWSVITMYVDRKAHTTGVLFGNEAAVGPAQINGAAQATAPTRAYPAGAVLALVTWAQRDDPHWFGGRIPDVPQSAEFLQFPAAGQAPGYKSFKGSGFVEHHVSAGAAAIRSSFLLDLTPARLP
jgi:mono/diheme cytochrome c family protein